ncbi:4-(cytidine 5'-diphospho)-2-C-methyl-D-erythritol kinase [Acidobacteriota bacterium]
MKLKSFAKINFGLEVLRKRTDGYHEIRTLFQTIDFYDLLTFRLLPNDEVRLSGDCDQIPWDETNLIHRAARLLKRHCHVSGGAEIVVEKKVPPGKGLGGGSSNAAVTLSALNSLWETSLEKQELVELGKQIGADVPYFFEGGLCLGLGRGDEITPLEDIPKSYCLLALPELVILTAKVYEQCRPSLTSEDKDSKIIRFLDIQDFGLLANDLEETVFKLYPQIKAIKDHLQNLRPALSLVSGTGSAVFGLFIDFAKAMTAFEDLKQKHTSLLVETVSREQYWDSMCWGVAKR